MARKKQSVDIKKTNEPINKAETTAACGLKELTEQWMQLERKTMDQRRKAALFYDKYLMKPIEEEYIRNNKDMVFEEVEYMIVSVGTSYEPIVLNIRLLHPGKILFLYTEKSHRTMSKVIEYCKLNPMQYEKIAYYKSQRDTDFSNHSGVQKMVTDIREDIDIMLKYTTPSNFSSSVNNILEERRQQIDSILIEGVSAMLIPYLDREKGQRYPLKRTKISN